MITKKRKIYSLPFTFEVVSEIIDTPPGPPGPPDEIINGQEVTFEFDVINPETS